MQADHPVRAHDVAWRLVDDEMVLVSAEKGAIFSLSSVGAFVWERSDGTRDIVTLVEDVCDAFEVDPDRAAVDVLAFVEEMRSEGLMAAAREGVA